MQQSWDWWRAALAGNFGPISDGVPHAGFYRTRRKGQPWEPVAIWADDASPDGWIALKGATRVSAIDLWTWCCRNPIAEEDYHRAVAGEGWADEPPSAPQPGAGHNTSDDPVESLRLEYLGEKELVDEFLKEPIKTKADADRASIWSKRLADIAKRATEAFTAEKRPVLEEARKIDDRWRELKEDPKALSVQLKRHQDDWLREQDRLEQERQRKARVEAEAARLEAERAAKALAEASVADGAAAAAEAAERAAQKAADAEREAQARSVRTGRTGSSVSLRTFVSGQITDIEALLIALKDREEIKEVAQTLANRAARSGVSLPGMKIVEEKRAA